MISGVERLAASYESRGNREKYFQRSFSVGAMANDKRTVRSVLINHQALNCAMEVENVDREIPHR